MKDNVFFEEFKNKFSPMTLKFLQDPNSFETLGILGDDTGDEVPKRIAKILETNETVTKLVYFSDSMTDEGATAFGEMLKKNKTITDISIVASKVKTVGGQKLAEGIQGNTKIQKLFLHCNNIGDEGIKAICLALEHHKTIGSITFHSHNLTDSQLKVVAESLEKNKNITEFSITGINNQITENGMQHIERMLDSNPGITKGKLTIHHEKMNEAEADLFASKLKSCKEKLDCNLNKVKELAKFLNNNQESFIGEFDITYSPKHPSALRFYQKLVNKEPLSEQLKLINESIEPKNLFKQIDSYINYNYLSLSGICKNLQPEDNYLQLEGNYSPNLFYLDEGVISTIGKHLHLDDVI